MVRGQAAQLCNRAGPPVYRCVPELVPRLRAEELGTGGLADGAASVLLDPDPAHTVVTSSSFGGPTALFAVARAPVSGQLADHVDESSLRLLQAREEADRSSDEFGHPLHL